MDEIQPLIERTEQLLAQVRAAQQQMQRLSADLQTQGDALGEKLAQLRQAELSSPVETVEEVAPAPEPEELEIAKKPVVSSRKKKASAQPITPPMESDITSDRRAMPRRKGNPVSVLITNEEGTSVPIRSWVVDRSPGGLSLLVDEAIAAGTLVNVRPSTAPATFPWVQVEVKSCKPQRNSWILGCQFLEKLPWVELRLFG